MKSRAPDANAIDADVVLDEREVVKRSPLRVRVAILVTGVVSLVILAPVLREVYASLGEVGEANPLWVAAAVACVLGGFASTWTLQRLTLRVDAWSDVGAAQLAGNAASNVLPAGSAIGSVIQLRMLRRRGIDLTRAVTALTIAGLMSMVAGLLIFPVLIVIPVGDTSTYDVSEVARYGIAALIVLVPLMLVFLRGDRAMRWVARSCYNALSRLPARRRPPADLADRIVAERDAVRDALRRHKVEAIVSAIGRALGDFLALYASVLAVGIRPSPTVVLVAFIAANAAGMLPFTPGGLGFVEAGLTGTLILSGAQEDAAAAAVAIYRLVSTWLPVLAGVGAYGWSRRWATVPAVRRTSSVGAAENTCFGVPAAAHTTS